MDFHKDLKDFLALLPCRQVLLYDTLHNEGNSSTPACIYILAMCEFIYHLITYRKSQVFVWQVCVCIIVRFAPAFFSSLFVNYSMKIKLIESGLAKNKLENMKVEYKVQSRLCVALVLRNDPGPQATPVAKLRLSVYIVYTCMYHISFLIHIS